MFMPEQPSDHNEETPGAEPEDRSISFAEAGGEIVYRDKSSADERLEERRREETEQTRKLREQLASRPDLAADFDAMTKDEGSPEHIDREREQLFLNLSRVTEETLQESSAILEGDSFSIYSIFKNAPVEQVESWVLLILENFQGLEKPEQEKRISALRKLRAFVNRNHFQTATEAHLEELRIQLDSQERTEPPAADQEKKSGFFSWLQRFLK